jgi:flagellar M-ring protein FliF
MLNFEVSETQRNVVKTPGDIKRVSVAVLIDGQTVTATDGTQTTTPRPEEELVVLRELVTSAAGLDTARGDVLTMKSLNFQPIILIDAAPPTGVFAALFGTLNLMEIIKVVTLSVVALVLGLFVIRPILMSSPKRERRLALPGMQLALPGTNAGSGQTIALTGEIDDGRAVTRLAQTQAASVTNEMDPVARLRRLIDERQDESLEILRGWMEPQEERI